MSVLLMSRKHATELGKSRYRTGRLCPQGHRAERYTSTGNCVACGYENKKRWEAANPEKITNYSKEYYDHNRDSLLPKSRAWHAKNKDRHRALNKRWHAANPEARRIHQSKRRARRKACAGNFTPAQIRELFAKQREKCVFCLISIKQSYHIDHIMPLSRGGSNGIGNIQLLCPICNQRKYAKDPLVFARENGRLL